jgi:hypothetical protein
MKQEEFRPERSTHESYMRQLVREQLEYDLLYEGLILSHSIEDVMKKLHREGYSFYGKDNAIMINFPLTANDNEANYKKLNNLMDTIFGWTHGTTSVGTVQQRNKLEFLELNNGTITLQYEKKFDSAIEQEDVPKPMYHISPYKNMNRIMKNGLNPKDSDNLFTFNNRIYFSDNIESLRILSKEKCRILKKYSFVIFRVYPIDNKFFFVDKNFTTGFYTKNNIEPISITPVEVLRLNTKREITKIIPIR